MRLVGGALAAVAVGVLCAVVLGDYPITETVMWTAAVLVPVLIGVTFTAISGTYQALLWTITGPLAAVSLAWGVRIASGWGLDSVPAFAWSAVIFGLVWPPAVGFWLGHRHPSQTPGAATTSPPPPSDVI